MTDKQLIDGCIKKNRYYQKLFFEKYSGKILLLVRFYSRNEQEAEDFVQEVFISAFQNIKKFKFNATLETWLKRIAINCALKNIKKKSFKNELIGIPNHLNFSQVNTIIENLGFKELLNYIQQLPLGYRVVFTLNVLEGFSHNEIAAELNIKASTSRSQLTKAKRLLKKIITINNKIPSTYE